MTKVKRIIKIALPATVILLAVALVLAYVFVLRVPSSQEVFDRSQHFVVELKSQNQDGTTTYGSAVLIDKDGTLVSNSHVVLYRKAGEYKAFETFAVRFSFEMDFRAASLLKYDIDKDIAVLKLEDTSNLKIKPSKIASSSKIKSGDRVYAVGNGMNHGVAINQGIIALPQVNIEYEGKIRGVIQCDLIVNEGNSGGALLNERGNLIGITTFRLKDSSGNPIYGVAFCIPINIVVEFLEV